MTNQKMVQSGKKKDLAAGFGTNDADRKRAVATDFVIDCNKREVTDTVNKKETKMTE